MKSAEEIYELFLGHPLIVTDSRQVVPGSVFIGLKGDRFDGNHFAGDAIRQGAALAIVDDPGIADGKQYIVVQDSLKTLQKLATIHRKNLKSKIIGITGSNGKTTTKELIGRVLSSTYTTTVTRGNLNNHIGVPLTILSLKDEEFAVVELGANHPGEIASLCEIAMPDFGIITNIGKAHLEGFGSLEGVAKAKSELYVHIRKHDGLVFVNKDHRQLMELAGGLRMITYGASPDADCTGKITSLYPGLAIDSAWGKKGLTAETSLYGDYNFENVMAAIAVGLYFDVKPELVSQAVSSYVPQNNRSQWEKTDHNLLMLDAYNANPSSMRAALLHFSRLDMPSKMVILGDMMELGDDSRKEHQEVVDLMRQMSFVQTILIGENFSLAAGNGSEACFRNTGQAADWLLQHPVRNATILLKGSRLMHLEILKEIL